MTAIGRWHSSALESIAPSGLSLGCLLPVGNAWPGRVLPPPSDVFSRAVLRGIRGNRQENRKNVIAGPAGRCREGPYPNRAVCARKRGRSRVKVDSARSARGRQGCLTTEYRARSKQGCERRSRRHCCALCSSADLCPNQHGCKQRSHGTGALCSSADPPPFPTRLPTAQPWRPAHPWRRARLLGCLATE